LRTLAKPTSAIKKPRMNPKQTRYILIAGVTLVWGLVIYRVVAGMSDDDQPIAVAQKQETFDYSVQADTFSLIADYPDPFIPGNGVPEIAHVPTEEKMVPGGGVRENTTPPAPGFDKTSVQYHGMIANPERKIRLGSVTIKGKQHLVREKQKVDELTIRKIENDRIVLIHQGKIITVDRE